MAKAGGRPWDPSVALTVEPLRTIFGLYYFGSYLLGWQLYGNCDQYFGRVVTGRFITFMLIMLECIAITHQLDILVTCRRPQPPDTQQQQQQ